MADRQHLAIARQGRVAWNDWRQRNPAIPADFSGVDFTGPENSSIFFAGFHFGDNANFTNTTFGDCQDSAIMAPEDVLFELHRMGEATGGAAIFLGAKFGDKADFSSSVFGVCARFADATFGNYPNFEGATFRETADFRNMTLGKFANFTKTTFANGASFRRTSFGDEVLFIRTHFGDRVDFQQTVFMGRAEFSPEQIGYGIVFGGAIFENRVVFGKHVEFGENADFRGAIFHRMSVWQGVKFGKAAMFVGTTFAGSVDFRDVVFGDRTTFVGASFEDKAVFSNTLFGDGVKFDSLPEEDVAKRLRKVAWALPGGSSDKDIESRWSKTRLNPRRFSEISFRSARFSGHASFNNRHFHNEADFAFARFSQPPELRNVEGHDQFHWVRVLFKFRGAVHPPAFISRGKWAENLAIPTPGWTTDSDIPTRLRRLRKIAHEIHATDAERDLFILERLAERGISWKSEWRRPWRPFVPTVLMGLYRLLSDCGRSVILPLLWLVASNVGFYFWYGSLFAPGSRTEHVADALFTFTLANAVPFVGATRQSLGTAIETLFSDGVPPFIQALSTGQGILSAVFFFLAALALRNYFKVK